MKKIIFSLFIVGIVLITCLLTKLLFFNKTVPTGDQNGKFLTNYSSKDMLGIWEINLTKQSENLTVECSGTMNISSCEGTYFYGTITISETVVNNQSIDGGTIDIEGSVYNDIVTIYFDSNKEYLNINYEANFTPQVLNNHIVLNFDTFEKEENKADKYIFKLIKMEVYNNEK